MVGEPRIIPISWSARLRNDGNVGSSPCYQRVTLLFRSSFLPLIVAPDSLPSSSLSILTPLPMLPKFKKLCSTFGLSSSWTFYTLPNIPQTTISIPFTVLVALLWMYPHLSMSLLDVLLINQHDTTDVIEPGRSTLKPLLIPLAWSNAALPSITSQTISYKRLTLTLWLPKIPMCFSICWK